MKRLVPTQRITISQLLISVIVLLAVLLFVVYAAPVNNMDKKLLHTLGREGNSFDITKYVSKEQIQVGVGVREKGAVVPTVVVLPRVGYEEEVLQSMLTVVQQQYESKKNQVGYDEYVEKVYLEQTYPLGYLLLCEKGKEKELISQIGLYDKENGVKLRELEDERLRVK